MKIVLRKRKRINRSPIGNGGVIAFLCIMGVFMALPLVFVISNAFKPLDELFVFPQRLFVRHPTINNFRDLFILMTNSWVPFTRYIFNTVFITAIGTAGHVLLASLAAYAIAKHDFPGRKLLDSLIVLSLMFSAAVTFVPNYLIMAKLGWVDTYLSVIVPSFSSSLGLYLMRQFMETVPDSLIESARIDGAGEFITFWNIVMPAVKPAWLTLIILSVQSLWNSSSGYIFSEELKTLPIALNQIIAGGIARTGVSCTVGLVMITVPVITFILSQRKIIETMTTSGMRE